MEIAWARWDLIIMVENGKYDASATHSIKFVWNKKFCTTGLSSSGVVDVGDMIFHLYKEARIDQLLRIFVSLLKDDFPDVRLNIISKPYQVNQVIEIDFLSQSTILNEHRSHILLRIYLFSFLQLKKGPIKVFKDVIMVPVFVQSKFSPDACHILGGCSDGLA